MLRWPAALWEEYDALLIAEAWNCGTEEELRRNCGTPWEMRSLDGEACHIEVVHQERGRGFRAATVGIQVAQLSEFR